MTQTTLNQIWQLWKSGKTYQSISDKTGYCTSRIGQVISNQTIVALKRGGQLNNKGGSGRPRKAG